MLGEGGEGAEPPLPFALVSIIAPVGRCWALLVGNAPPMTCRLLRQEPAAPQCRCKRLPPFKSLADPPLWPLIPAEREPCTRKPASAASSRTPPPLLSLPNKGPLQAKGAQPCQEGAPPHQPGSQPWAPPGEEDCFGEGRVEARWEATGGHLWVVSPSHVEATGCVRERAASMCQSPSPLIALPERMGGATRPPPLTAPFRLAPGPAQPPPQQGPTSGPRAPAQPLPVSQTQNRPSAAMATAAILAHAAACLPEAAGEAWGAGRPAWGSSSRGSPSSAWATTRTGLLATSGWARPALAPCVVAGAGAGPDRAGSWPHSPGSGSEGCWQPAGGRRRRS